MDSSSGSMHQAAWTVILVLIGVFSIGRFVGLEQSPPGLYADEAAVATEAIALQQTGFNSHHERTLFTPIGDGGYASPTHLYPKALWLSVAGYSISALRAYAGLEGTLLLAGLFMLARSRLDGRTAVFVLLAGCLSPWIFQFSRCAVDDPMLSLGGLVWGMYFFLRSGKPFDAVVAAACFSVSVYAYAAARVTLPLLFPFLLWAKPTQSKFTLRYLAAFAITGLVLCFPLLHGIVQGPLLARYATVGVFSPRALAGRTWAAGWGDFFSNFRLHLAPDYLLLHGDANLRHSTQFVGEFSWLDIFAWALGLLVFGSIAIRTRHLPLNRFVVLCVAGFVIGIIPAALTRDGVPHAIRGSDCWPFVALTTGFALHRIEQRWRWALPGAALVAAVFAGAFLRYYFLDYPREAAEAFQVTRLAAAQEGRRTGNWAPLARLTRNDPPLAVRYYLIAYGGRSFVESARLFEGLLPAGSESRPAARDGNPGTAR